MKRIMMFVSVVVMSVVASGPVLAQSNSSIGTWKLNLAKSKYVNIAAPKSETRTVEAQGNGAKYTYEGVAADGSRIAYSFTTNYDGKDSKISGVGFPNGADTIAGTRVNANTVTSSSKKAGVVVQTTRSVVSADGMVTTLTAKGTNAKGEPTSNIAVWDKQ